MITLEDNFNAQLRDYPIIVEKSRLLCNPLSLNLISSSLSKRFFAIYLYSQAQTYLLNCVKSISGGGRYENLVEMFCSNQFLQWEARQGFKEFLLFFKKEVWKAQNKNPCQVLVATIKQVPVQEKLKVLNKLWRSNIKAETLYVQKAKTDKQIKHAFSNKIPLIIWLGEEQLKAGKANLKILYQHKETKIGLDNIGEECLPYVLQFRKDFQLGKVKFEEP